MSYPPYCICCSGKIKSSKAVWSSDWDANSDFGLEHEGIIGLYICSNEACRAHMEIRDLQVLEDEEERSIKYYFDDDGYPYEHVKASVDHCVYCSSTLEAKEVKPTDNNGEYSECITSIYECPECHTLYEVEDLYPIKELFERNDDYLDLYDSRTVIIKECSPEEI